MVALLRETWRSEYIEHEMPLFVSSVRVSSEHHDRNLLRS